MELIFYKSKPLVSILITLFNQKNFYQRAIASVINQSYENIEIIIGDDASTDGFNFNTPDQGIHKNNIRYIRYNKNVGRHENFRNLLFKESKGDLATILNADDFFIGNDYIQKAVNIFLNNENVSMVFGHTGVFLEDKNEIYYDKTLSFLPKIMKGNDLLLMNTKGVVIPHVSSIYNRNLAIKLDFYRFPYLSQDWEGLLRIIQGYNVGYVHTPVALYGRHHQNVSKTSEIEILIKSINYIDGPYQHALELGQIPEKEIRSWYKKMRFRYLMKCYLKTSLRNQANKEKFISTLKKSYPELYQELTSDIRFQILKLVKKSPFILTFIFKYILKQEGLIREFLHQNDERTTK